MKKKITLLIALSGVFIFGIVLGDCKMPDTNVVNLMST